MGKVTKLSGLDRTAVSRPVPITSAHDTSQFECGKPLLNDWLRQYALKSEGKSARTYVVSEGSEVIGYYWLAAGGVSRPEFLKSIRQGMPNPVPVVILGRLAVNAKHQKKGMGSALLQDALQRSVDIASLIGAAAVLVHAIDDEPKAFYLGYGFVAFPADSKTLFLPIETIRKAL